MDEIPKNETRPVWIKYQDKQSLIEDIGKFVWDPNERAFIECVAGFDGIGLYDDEYNILKWANKKKDLVSVVKGDF